MNQKGFVNIVLIVLVVILAGAVGYFVLRKPTPTVQVSMPTESEILVSLKTNWQTVQALIPFRPVYHNQAENEAKIWRTPTAAQFLGKNDVVVRFEDDNNVHVAVFNFDGGKFSLLETFQNQGEFASSDWQNLINKYGAASYSPSTYAKDLMRNGELVSFQDLTRVTENVFLKNYWAVSQSSSPLDETANWENFRDENNSYELKYPADIFEVVATNTIQHKLKTFHRYSEKDGSDLGLASDMTISFAKGDSECKTIEPLLKEIAVPFKFPSIKGLKYETGAEGEGAIYYCIKNDENKTIFLIKRLFLHETYSANLPKQLDFISGQKQENITNQILSTFKFLK